MSDNLRTDPLIQQAVEETNRWFNHKRARLMVHGTVKEKADLQRLIDGMGPDERMRFLRDVQFVKDAHQRKLRKRPYCNGLEGLDPECRELAEALNDQPGVVTIGSCSGHGKRNFFISFKIAPDMNEDYASDLARLLSGLEDDPSFRQSWRIEANYTNGVWFALLGPKGASGDGLAKTLRRRDQDASEGT